MPWELEWTPEPAAPTAFGSVRAACGGTQSPYRGEGRTLRKAWVPTVPWWSLLQSWCSVVVFISPSQLDMGEDSASECPTLPGRAWRKFSTPASHHVSGSHYSLSPQFTRVGWWGRQKSPPPLPHFTSS